MPLKKKIVNFYLHFLASAQKGEKRLQRKEPERELRAAKSEEEAQSRPPRKLRRALLANSVAPSLAEGTLIGADIINLAPPCPKR